MNRIQKRFTLAAVLLGAFALLTAAVCFVDVRQIGPQDSSVGFAGINGFIHSLTGVHFSLYNLTDWLGLLPIGVCLGFAVAGLAQWVRRKRLRAVDFSILLLGGFYTVTIAVYLFFERFVINYRPVLINGYPEASYPSSTTVLTICVMSTAVLQLRSRSRRSALRNALTFAAMGFTAFMVIGRLVSGVHWFTDILGGILLSGGLIALYDAVSKLSPVRTEKHR